MPSEWTEHSAKGMGLPDTDDIFAAAFAGNIADIEHSLVDSVKNDGETPLHKAIRGNRINAITFLLENGADPNLKPSIDGLTYKSALTLAEAYVKDNLDMNNHDLLEDYLEIV